MSLTWTSLTIGLVFVEEESFPPKEVATNITGEDEEDTAVAGDGFREECGRIAVNVVEDDAIA